MIAHRNIALHPSQPVIVTLHLEVEDLGLGGAGGWDEVGVEQREDAVADAGELGLDLGAVGADGGGVRGAPRSRGRPPARWRR